MWQRFVVRKNERGFLLREDDFVRVLAPGVTRVFDPLKRFSVQVHSLAMPGFAHPLAEYLRREEPAMVETYFHRVDLGEDEAALRYEDGVLAEVLPLGARRLYWREPLQQRFERILVAEGFEVPTALAACVQQPMLRSRPIFGIASMLQVQVPTGQVGVLKVDGVVVRLLAPGPAAFWRFNRDVSVELVDMRLQAMEVSGQEILTRDKVALRINLAANWRYTDVLLAFAQLAKPVEHLYRELQFALRAAVGTRTLDELLERKELIDQLVATQLREQFTALGIEVVGVGVKDIILPGEMKLLLAKVVEAEKAAQANVIRRREETAATRSLLNTAKVMEDNPVALRLKELESLERIAERIDHISVLGGLDGVLNSLARVVPEALKRA